MTKDMTSGSTLRHIINFAVPLCMGMLFQQLYSMVDTMIVGKVLGVQPLAGVGATGSLNFMIIWFCIGICNGFSIPIAQAFGANKEVELRRYVANSTWLCIFFSIVITFFVAIFTRNMLVLLKTPEDIFEYAYIYILIIFLGIPCYVPVQFPGGGCTGTGRFQNTAVFSDLVFRDKYYIGFCFDDPNSARGSRCCDCDSDLTGRFRFDLPVLHENKLRFTWIA